MPYLMTLSVWRHFLSRTVLPFYQDRVKKEIVEVQYVVHVDSHHNENTWLITPVYVTVYDDTS